MSKIRLIGIGVLLAMVFTMVVSFIPGHDRYYDGLGDRWLQFGTQTVEASGNSYSVTLSEGNRYNSYNPTYNYHNAATLYVGNWFSYRDRVILRLPKQSVAGTIDSVELRVKYIGTSYPEDAPGTEMRAYRVTRQVVLADMTWNIWKWNNNWTTAGGDFTTADYDYDFVPSTDETWMSWDVTDMALTEWNNDKDLYVMLRYRHEVNEENIAALHGVTAPTSGNRPRMIVDYTESIPDPTVAVVETSEKTSTTAQIKITPSLQGRDDVDIFIEWHVTGGGSWVYSKSPKTVTNDGDYFQNMTGLSPDTEYDVRGVIEFDSTETAYSSVIQVTTLDFEPVALTDPVVLTADLSGADIRCTYDTHDVTHGFLWLQYRSQPHHTWEDTTSYAVDGDGHEDFNVSPPGGRTGPFECRCAFVTGDDYYYSGITQDTFGNEARVTWSIDDVGNDFIHIRADIEIRDSTDVDVRAELRLGSSGTADHTLGPFTHVGDGYRVFQFTQLIPHEYYEWRGVAETEGLTTATQWDGIWPTEVEYAPLIEGVSATFSGLDVMDLKADLTLRDVTWPVHLSWEIWRGGVLRGVSPGKVVDKDGVHTIQAIIGEVFQWDMSYDVRPRIGYGMGVVYGTYITAHVPSQGVDGVLTLEATNIGHTSAQLNARLWLEERDGATVLFSYWPEGADISQRQTTEGRFVLSGKTVGILVRNLDPDRTYRFRAEVELPWRGRSAYGGTLEFVTKSGIPRLSWADWFPMVEWPGFPERNVLLTILGLVITVAAGGVLMWKLRARSGQLVAIVAMVGCVSVFSIMGWFPVWIVILMAGVLVLGGIWVVSSGFSERGGSA